MRDKNAIFFFFLLFGHPSFPGMVQKLKNQQKYVKKTFIQWKWPKCPTLLKKNLIQITYYPCTALSPLSVELFKIVVYGFVQVF